MERIERVLLVVPPGTVFVQPDGTKQCKECIPPLGLGYLAAQLSMLGDYEIRVYDMVVEDFYQEIFVSPNIDFPKICYNSTQTVSSLD